MMSQIITCCKCYGTQSMWYNVVNSIPCLLKSMIIWTGIVLLLFVILKYGVEWVKLFRTSSADKSKGTKTAVAIAGNQNQQSGDITEREKKLSDELAILKEVSRQKEGLWKSYKELLEENYKKEEMKKTVDEKTKPSDIE